MFGLLSAPAGQRAGAAGGTPSDELVRDKDIDHPEFWDNEGPGGTGSIVSGGEIFSLDDGGDKPTTGSFGDGKRATIGLQYRCRVQMLTSRDGLFRVIALDADTGDEQIIVTTTDVAQLVDVTFTASVAATHIRFRFFEIAIRLTSASIVPAIEAEL